MVHPALSTTRHRPWPLPGRPWILGMGWEDLLFLHWPVAADSLRPHLPDGLEVDTFDGTAWLGVVPFYMRMRFRGLPPLPTGRRFPEINVRTYVLSGDRAGVWFFSLDASSRLAVAGARAAFGLPYLRARMRCERVGDEVRYASVRTDHRAPPARFEARYRAVGTPQVVTAGTLEHFLTERYGMFVGGRAGRIALGDIAHPPWRLAPASVQLDVCDMTRLLGFELQGPPVSALVAGPQSVVGWWLRPR